MDRENGGCLRVFPPDEKIEGVDEGSGYKNESLRLQSCLAVNDGIVLSGSEADGRVRAWNVVSGKTVGNVDVGESADSKGVQSVVRWREGSEIEDRRGVWAAAGVEGIVKVYG